MKNLYICLFSLALCISGSVYAQKNILQDQFKNNLQKDEITRMGESVSEAMSNTGNYILKTPFLPVVLPVCVLSRLQQDSVVR
jgi:uncharacterized protein YxeA